MGSVSARPLSHDEPCAKVGYAFKESAHLRAYRKRWLVLTATHLYTFKPAAAAPTASIELLACRVCWQGGGAIVGGRCLPAFVLVLPGHHYTFACADRPTCVEWIAVIGELAGRLRAAPRAVGAGEARRGDAAGAARPLRAGSRTATTTPGARERASARARAPATALRPPNRVDDARAASAACARLRPDMRRLPQSPPDSDGDGCGGGARAAAAARCEPPAEEPRLLAPANATLAQLRGLNNGAHGGMLLAMVVAHNGGDVAACERDLIALADWDTLFADLEALGFCDATSNRAALIESHGDMHTAVRALVKGRAPPPGAPPADSHEASCAY